VQLFITLCNSLSRAGQGFSFWFTRQRKEPYGNGLFGWQD